MELIFLGTGTSQGVPMIAHDAPGLDLDNPKNWRTRSSIHLVMDGLHIQVDAGADFRMQCIHNKIEKVDLFLLTHYHADHIMGMDDLRRFCTINGSKAMPIYSSSETLKRVETIFEYAIREKPLHPYYPAFSLNEMPGTLELDQGTIHTTTLPHGPTEVLGFSFIERSSQKKITYYTDCKEVGPKQRELANGSDILILDGLQPKPHSSHMSIAEAVETAKAIEARETYLIHMNFYVDHETVQAQLPPGINLAYDGLRLNPA